MDKTEAQPFRPDPRCAPRHLPLSYADLPGPSRRGTSTVPASFDRLIVGTVVSADAVIDHGCVAIHGGTNAAIEEGRLPAARQIVENSGRLIFPGLLDGQMHTSSFTGWAGIESGTRCAAAGGVTTRGDVPHPVSDAAILADKIGWERHRACRYGTLRHDPENRRRAPSPDSPQRGCRRSSSPPLTTTRCGSRGLIIRPCSPRSAKSPKSVCPAPSTTKIRSRRRG